jgi:hypothetical protein
MGPNLYQPKSGLVVTIPLEFLDMYGAWNAWKKLTYVSQPRPKTCYKVYTHLTIK